MSKVYSPLTNNEDLPMIVVVEVVRIGHVFTWPVLKAIFKVEKAFLGVGVGGTVAEGPGEGIARLIIITRSKRHVCCRGRDCAKNKTGSDEKPFHNDRKHDAKMDNVDLIEVRG